jgi:hypothetical protein
VRTRILLLGLCLAAACGDRTPEPRPTRDLRSAAEPIRIGMDELHQSGGVPPGWRFTLPEGDANVGRQTFVDLGCHTCHAVKGEKFSPAGDGTHVGPELTGMGSHHPPGYFAESILNPDAVVVDGPGYAGEDGRSRMPSYPDLTLVQLVDVVAYLETLTDATGHFMGSMAVNILPERPPTPQTAARLFFVQAYEVKPGQLGAFQDWFAAEALPALRAADGFVAVDTHVDNTRPGGGVVTVITFRDEDALSRFLNGTPGADIKRRFDEFIGPHGHQLFRTPPFYPVEALSGRG